MGVLIYCENNCVPDTIKITAVGHKCCVIILNTKIQRQIVTFEKIDSDRSSSVVLHYYGY